MFDLSISIRRLLSSKFNSVVNIIGLTIGLTIFLLLINYVYIESSYEKHHIQSDRTYQIGSRFTNNQGTTGTFGITFGILAESYLSNFPDVERAAHTYGPIKMELDVSDQRFNNLSIVYSDYAFVEIFDFEGITKAQYMRPDQALINEKVAESLFGSSNPVGQRITVDEIDYQISGIISTPNYSRFEFDVLLPLNSLPDIQDFKNGGLEFETFLVSKEKLDEAMVATLTKHYNDLMLAKWPLYTPENFMLPISEVYLNEHGLDSRFGNGNSRDLNVMTIIAFIILSLAIINYLNLQIAFGYTRAKELKIKKIMGAKASHIIMQGISEAGILLIMATTISLVFYDLILSLDSGRFFGNSIHPLSQWSPEFYLSLLAFLILLALISGAIPAIKLFREGSINPGIGKSGKTKLGAMTRIMVVSQFVITSVLLSGIGLIHWQIEYLKNQPKGYSEENVVIIKNLNDLHLSKYEIIKTQLMEHPSVVSVSGSQSEPGNGASGQFVHRMDQSEEQGISVAHIRTMDGYLNTFGLSLTQGSDFGSNNDSQQFILNERARDQLFGEEENVIGSRLEMSGRQGTIVGVVEDFHFRSLHHSVQPLILNVEAPYRMTLAIRLTGKENQSSMAYIQGVLNDIDPKYSIDYRFLDENYERHYRKELQTEQIVTYASGVALLISMMGLLGLTLFVINARTKEIAIRKVVGAKELHLFLNLSMTIIQWILLGHILSIPIIYFFGSSWLNDFVYHLDSWLIFLLVPAASIITVTVALLVILNKLIQTVRLNPIVFLRNE